MAAKSATSSMKSDPTLKAFVTFRVVGDNLVPNEITQLLKMQPTYARLKGKTYSTGRSANIIPSTNIWFFSTDTVMASNNIVDHVRLILFIFGLMEFDGVSIFLSKSSAKATMTFFWHGTSISSVPKIPELLLDLLKLIEVEVEVDFDKDEDDSRTTSRRRSRAA
jgi:hypothetical protein